jgi:hypothetical protein
MLHDQVLQNGGVSPFSAYRVLSTTFNLGLLGLTAATAVLRRFQTPLSPPDLITFGVAAHKIAMIVTKERVTMPLRAPFTAQSDSGRAGGHESLPAGQGMRRALGELLTCPHCMAPWVALALLTGYVVAPLPTRAIATLFTTVALADVCHHGYAWLDAARTRSQRRAQHDERVDSSGDAPQPAHFSA